MEEEGSFLCQWSKNIRMQKVPSEPNGQGFHDEKAVTFVLLTLENDNSV